MHTCCAAVCTPAHRQSVLKRLQLIPAAVGKPQPMQQGLTALWCAQVSMLETDRLNWQERYQESLRRSTPASPAHSMPASRAGHRSTPETSPFHSQHGAPDRAQSIVAAAYEESEQGDDLDRLIRSIFIYNPVTPKVVVRYEYGWQCPCSLTEARHESVSAGRHRKGQ